MEWWKVALGFIICGTILIIFKCAVRLIVMYIAMTSTTPQEYQQWMTRTNLLDWLI